MEVCKTDAREAMEVVCKLIYFEVIILTCISILTEAVALRCFVKKVFLEISQNSQENSPPFTSMQMLLHMCHLLAVSQLSSQF